jgi:phage terminase large subunit-like protein
MKRITTRDKKELEAFIKLCSDVAKAEPADPQEEAGAKRKRIQKLLGNYDLFFEYYFPNFAKSKTAKFHIKFANSLLNDVEFRGIFEGHRGCAKSVHVDMGIPLWLKFKGELKCMLLVGQTEKKAFRLLATLQAQLSHNRRIINDFGDQSVFGDWGEGEFTTKDGEAFFAIGIGQSPNGTRKDEYRPDYIAVDDVDNRVVCRNPSRVREFTNWILEDLMGCFDVGRQRFVFTNSRIAKTSILASLVEQMVVNRAQGKWHWIKVNVLDEKGNPTWPEKYTKQHWEKVRTNTTLRAWNANYMNNPIEEGTIFKHDWIQWKEISTKSLIKYDALVLYGDPSFKSTPGSDFKAVKLWGKIGREFHLIKSFVRQTTVSAMVKFYYDVHESLPEGATCEYWMEANMLQDLLLDEFTTEGEARGYQLPIRGDKRKKDDKFTRIEATSPFYERGFVFYNALEKESADMQRAVEHLLAFEKGSGAPDDSPDADEGALDLLQKRHRQDSFTPITGGYAIKQGY